MKESIQDFANVFAILASIVDILTDMVIYP